MHETSIRGGNSVSKLFCRWKVCLIVVKSEEIAFSVEFIQTTPLRILICLVGVEREVSVGMYPGLSIDTKVCLLYFHSIHPGLFINFLHLWVVRS